MSQGGLDYVNEYKSVVTGIIDGVLKDQWSNIKSAARLCADSLSKGGLIYVFGTGHSMLMVIEVFYRSGGLAPIYPIIDPNLLGLSGMALSSSLERLPGYASTLLNSQRIIPNSTMIIISNSGKNACTSGDGI